MYASFLLLSFLLDWYQYNHTSDVMISYLFPCMPNVQHCILFPEGLLLLKTENQLFPRCCCVKSLMRCELMNNLASLCGLSTLHSSGNRSLSITNNALVNDYQAIVKTKMVCGWNFSIMGGGLCWACYVTYVCQFNYQNSYLVIKISVSMKSCCEKWSQLHNYISGHLWHDLLKAYYAGDRNRKAYVEID